MNLTTCNVAHASFDSKGLIHVSHTNLHILTGSHNLLPRNYCTQNCQRLLHQDYEILCLENRFLFEIVSLQKTDIGISVEMTVDSSANFIQQSLYLLFDNDCFSKPFPFSRNESLLFNILRHRRYLHLGKPRDSFLPSVFSDEEHTYPTIFK
jgi:hypothetical protein